MNTLTAKIFTKLALVAWRLTNWNTYRIYCKFRSFTMIPEHIYVNNLLLVQRYRHIPGAIVECGVWKGGMIAGIAQLLGNDREYFLFDSFEGLPPATEIDGDRALSYQREETSPYYFNNCMAEQSSAERAMKLSGAKKVNIQKGWFSETLPAWPSSRSIGILRLDCDWYGSTSTCLESLFNKVAAEGIIILDDYNVWDGFSRAVHDFLSNKKLKEKIRQFNNDISYIVKET